jgi:hypothetical protein
MLNNVLNQVIFLIGFKFFNDFVLGIIEDNYEFGKISTFLLYTTFNLIPILILNYVEINKKCKDSKTFLKLEKTLYKSLIKLGGTEIFKMIVGFIPILGKILSLLEFIPYVNKFLSVMYYFIFAGIVNLFNKADKNYCNKISGLEKTSALILGGIYTFLELVFGLLPF